MKVLLLIGCVILGTYGASPTAPKYPRFMAMPDEQGNIRIEDLELKAAGPKAEITDVTFYLHTVDNPLEGEEIRADDFEALTASQYYQPSRQNAFLLHGWTGTSNSSYIVTITEALLAHYDMNVFAIDWSGPAGLFYTQAVKEVPSTGLIIGEFAQKMIDHYEITAGDFVLIGHSLGGQLVGSIGAALGGGADTVIGVDPAGPLFSLEEPDLALDPTDGQFVHVIHTNGGLLGFEDPCGHADYFPNGGDRQTDCGVDISGECSHTRSHLYFVESMYSGGFTSVKCTNYEDFSAGLCDDNEVSHLGQFPVDKSASGSYYLDTAAEPPYSLS